MHVCTFNRFLNLFRVFVALTAVSFGAAAFAETPTVGAKAADFTLLTPTGKTVQMSKELYGHKLVLVVLRGFPGYQCPYCVKQVHDFVEHAAEFAAKNVEVVLVYPGPPADLDQHAKDFLAKQSNLPANIVLVTDPDYTMTKAYGYVGMPRMRRPIPRHSSSTRTGWFFSRRSAAVTVNDCPRRIR